MSLFTLLKITRTRYLLGKKQVPPGTPGAEKVSEESRHRYAYRLDGQKQIKVKLFTDKAASMTKLAKMNTALERGAAEMRAFAIGASDAIMSGRIAKCTGWA